MRKCRDCQEQKEEFSKRRADVCLGCWDIRIKVLEAVTDGSITMDQFKLFQKGGNRKKRLVKMGLAHLAGEGL